MILLYSRTNSFTPYLESRSVCDLERWQTRSAKMATVLNKVTGTKDKEKSLPEPNRNHTELFKVFFVVFKSVAHSLETDETLS